MNYMKDKIDKLEFCSMVFMLIMSPFLGMGIYNLLKFSNNDAVISIFISYILNIIIFLIFKYIFNYKPKLDLNKKLNTLFKTKYIKISLALLFFINLTALSYNINSFIISQFLSETPIIFIVIIISILIIYINKKGIQIISRVSTFLALLSIILILIAIFGSYSTFDLTNILPILKDGIKAPLLGSFYTLTINSIYIFVLLIIPKENINNNQKLNKYIFITSSIVFLIFIAITTYTISVLGINLALMYHYPAYITMKEITIFGFIDKIENFIIIHWIFEMFITLSLIVYFVSKLTDIKPIIIITFNILFHITIFTNSTKFNYLVTRYIPISSVLIIIIMLIISIKIKKSYKTL